MEKNSFILFQEYEDVLTDLSNEQLGELFRAIFIYNRTKEIPVFSELAIKLAFNFIKQDLDRNNEVWEETKKIRSKAGKKGADIRWNKITVEETNDEVRKNNKDSKNSRAIKINGKNSKTINEIAKMAVNVNDNVNVNVNVNEDADDNNINNIIKNYEQNIGTISPASAELILSYLNDFSEEMIVEAIKIASQRNKRSAKYISGILNSWLNKNYTTLSDIKNEQLKDKNTNELLENEKERLGINNFDEIYEN